MTVYEPHGAVGVITPWNYPLQMTGRSVAPALAMGNVVILKPAEDTSLTALALAKLAEEAGFPKGALNVVTGLCEGYIALARHDGLPILAEGEFGTNLPAGGFYVKPALIGDVPPDHRLAQEEIFGPVLVAIRVRDETQALEIANGTNFGLVAGIWTSDLGRALRLSKKVRAGQVFINNYGAGSGIELPFGGMKSSGHGRERGSRRFTASGR